MEKYNKYNDLESLEFIGNYLPQIHARMYNIPTLYTIQNVLYNYSSETDTKNDNNTLLGI